MTKFPGGGLEFGEGIIDALQRECIEEFGQAFKVLDHFYTTDFFIASAFNNKQQLISIYYFMEPIEEVKFNITEKVFDFDEVEGAQSFRWISMDELNENCFTFPIDKHVSQLLVQHLT
jgi:ADP-ribose pyrophosphatase YjhB (NUDIX family)